MGEVYRGRDTRLDRVVAVKVLPAHLADNAELRQRLEREARAISALSHPHICTLFDVGNQDGTEYLVMEYLEGETLADRLLKGALPIEQALRYGIEIADALDKAHRQGILHRDLKPGNVMLTKSGVKLLDFGLARLKTPARGGVFSSLSIAPTELPGASLTAEGTILGTFQYMAPEQLEGREADARSDIFAFGAVLYEMATAKKAFTGRSQASLIASILEHDPAPISTVQPMTPPAFERVVNTCLAKDPEDRWQTAHDVMLELRWIAQAGSQAGAPAPVVARRRNRERIAWLAFALAAAAAGLLAVGYLRRAPAPRQVFRSSILPPSNAAFLYSALSPDGSRIVFRGNLPDGKSQLWIQSLTDLTAQPLAGTEEATFPFWSPDGRSIGFFANKKLKRMESSGGPGLTLCDADGAGGSWNRDGVILFALPSGPIYRIPAAGGAPEAVTRLDASRHETSHRYPVFLPDGRHFLYWAANLAGAVEDPANAAIRAGSLDSKEDRRILPGYSAAAYASGYVLFVREGSLFAQGFDAGKLRLFGEPRPVGQQVRDVGPFLRMATFSVSDNGVLIYEPPPLLARQMTWFDRDGKKIGTLGEPAALAGPRISPDGTKAAVSILDPSSRASDIWIFELARGTKKRLTADPSANTSPVWSPDGSRILFASDRKHQGDLYMKVAAGGSKEEPVYEAEGQKIPHDWSPDGGAIVFDDREAGGERRFSLKMLPPAGDRRPVELLKRGHAAGDSRFSPDGRWLAYMSDESGRMEIYVAAFPEPGGRWQISTEGGRTPRWRRDGRELFYVSAGSKLMSVEVKPGSSFEAGHPRALFDAPYRVPGRLGLPGFDVSADGQKFLFVTPAGESAPPPITLVVNWPEALRR
jgi:Tol biopolymer transport system component